MMMGKTGCGSPQKHKETNNHMKKIMGLMLGLSLALGCVAFADEAPAATKATKATKTKKTKKTKAANAAPAETK